MRKTYHLADADGFHKSSLLLDDEEAARYTGLLTVMPPQRVPLSGGRQNTPAEIKPIQWQKIKAMRDARKSGGFKVGLKWFHSDEPSRAQYGILLTTALEKLLLDGYVLNAAWKDMGGLKEPLTVGILRQIRDAGLTLEATLFAVAEAHRASMEAAPNPETYDFTTGWPATYQGTP